MSGDDSTPLEAAWDVQLSTARCVRCGEKYIRRNGTQGGHVVLAEDLDGAREKVTASWCSEECYRASGRPDGGCHGAWTPDLGLRVEATSPDGYTTFVGKARLR